MRLHQIEQKTQEWLELRKGKLTGTALKKIVGSKLTYENCFYEILAERLSVADPSDEESALDRGVRLESVALGEFEKETGKIVDVIGFCSHDDFEHIGMSPDGLIKNSKGKYTEGVEIKCLSSAVYVRAWLEDKIPKDYYPQAVQYFIVNRDLKTLYFTMFDPRIAIHPLHIIIVNRDDIEDDIDNFYGLEIKFLEEVENKLAEIIKV